MALRVSDLAAEVGLTGDAVRYYEREGLLPELEGTGARLSTVRPSAVMRLRFIKGAQRFGLRLREIRELLDIQDRGLCPCGHTQGSCGCASQR